MEFSWKKNSPEAIDGEREEELEDPWRRRKASSLEALLKFLQKKAIRAKDPTSPCFYRREQTKEGKVCVTN